MARRVDVAVIGAGQAGLATSWHLSQDGVDHIVLERGEVGNAWARQRWDSFCLVTPNWTITLPGAEYRGPDPHGFMPRDDYLALLKAWARSFTTPVHENVDVSRLSGEPGDFRLSTTTGDVQARAVVVATATHQRPKAAGADRLSRDLHQIAATQYRNPDALPPGGVLVVGSGQSGCQIAEELHAAGRDVRLVVSRLGRLPRRYRGRDCIEWQHDMGWLDRTPDMLESPRLRFRGDPHLSGRNGGHTLSLHKFRADGITLLGRLTDADGDRIALADDLEANLRFADDYARNFHASVDEHVERAGVGAPEPTAIELAGGPAGDDWMIASPRTVDLRDLGVTSVVWATGFTYDFSWIEFPVLDPMGYPATNRGETEVRGLCFTGLNWMHKRKSGIIYGAGDDARHVAEAVRHHLDR